MESLQTWKQPADEARIAKLFSGMTKSHLLLVLAGGNSASGKLGGVDQCWSQENEDGHRACPGRQRGTGGIRSLF